MWPSVSRIDPYLVWAEATRYRHFDGARSARIPIAIELKAGGQTAQQFAQMIEEQGWREWIWMSALYPDAPQALTNTRFCTAHVTTRDFFTHLERELSDKIQRFTLAMPIIRRDARAQHYALRVDHASLNRAPKREDIGRVIVDVCDDDVAYTHRWFFEDASRNATRFQCIWRQDDTVNDASGLGYGHELMKSHIDEMLRNRHRTRDANVYRLANHVRRQYGPTIMNRMNRCYR